MSAPPLVWVSTALPRDAWTASQPEARYGELPVGLQVVVTRLHDATARVIESTTFRETLDDLDVVYAAPGKRALGGRRFAAIYLGGYASTEAYRRHAICYRFALGNATATTDLAISEGACSADGTQVAVTALRRVTIDRASSAIVEERACAVNTFAHEWAHAISEQRDGTAMVFVDQRHQRHATPVASYVAGAVAQCLYLEQQRQDHPDGETFARVRCIEAVGTNLFQASTCAAGWSARFWEKP